MNLPTAAELLIRAGMNVNDSCTSALRVILKIFKKSSFFQSDDRDRTTSYGITRAVVNYTANRR